MFCIKCGSQLIDGAVFCSMCGTKVQILSESVENKQQVVGQQMQCHVKQPLSQRGLEWAEKSDRENQKLMLEKIEATKEQRNVRLITCAIIAFIALMVGVSSSLNLMQVGISSDTADSMVVSLIAFAVFAGIVLGMVRIGVSFNKLINTYENDLINFKRQIENNYRSI